MTMNFELDGDARSGLSLSFSHYPGIFMESRTPACRRNQMHLKWDATPLK
jgi:hypothetical protein